MTCRFLHFALIGLLCMACGCVSPHENLSSKEDDSAQTGPLVLHEGDIVRVTFPGAQNLNTEQTIRRDGRIVLPLVGEQQAAGLTPSDLNAQLSQLYAPQLVHKEVIVTVVSSAFTVFVSGAVLKPGKVVADRQLTALEAIMEAGGFDSAKANLKEVVVIRNGRPLPHKLDLKRILDGQNEPPFYLKPYDIVHVPDRFVVF